MRTIIKKAYEYFFLFVIGGTAYGLLETIWRGYTHWTMFITGGLCLCILYRTQQSSLSLINKTLIGALSITAVEFTVGCIVNIILGWNVWDYSDIKTNLLGQICLPFVFLWLILCPPAFLLCNYIKKTLFSKTT